MVQASTSSVGWLLSSMDMCHLKFLLEAFCVARLSLALLFCLVQSRSGQRGLEYEACCAKRRRTSAPAPGLAVVCCLLHAASEDKSDRLTDSIVRFASWAIDSNESIFSFDKNRLAATAAWSRARSRHVLAMIDSGCIHVSELSLSDDNRQVSKSSSDAIETAVLHCYTTPVRSEREHSVDRSLARLS